MPEKAFLFSFPSFSLCLILCPFSLFHSLSPFVLITSDETFKSSGVGAHVFIPELTFVCDQLTELAKSTRAVTGPQPESSKEVGSDLWRRLALGSRYLVASWHQTTMPPLSHDHSRTTLAASYHEPAYSSACRLSSSRSLLPLTAGLPGCLEPIRNKSISTCSTIAAGLVEFNSCALRLFCQLWVNLKQLRTGPLLPAPPLCLRRFSLPCESAEGRRVFKNRLSHEISYTSCCCLGRPSPRKTFSW